MRVTPPPTSLIVMRVRETGRLGEGASGSPNPSSNSSPVGAATAAMRHQPACWSPSGPVMTPPADQVRVVPPAAQPMRHPPCHRRLTDLVAAVADLRAAQHRLHQAEAARASAERLRSVAPAPQPPAAGDPTAASRPRTAAEIAALSFAAGPSSGFVRPVGAGRGTRNGPDEAGGGAGPAGLDRSRAGPRPRACSGPVQP